MVLLFFTTENSSCFKHYGIFSDPPARSMERNNVTQPEEQLLPVIETALVDIIFGYKLWSSYYH